MIPPGSRYQNADVFWTVAHYYSQQGYPVLEGKEGIDLHVALAVRQATYLVNTEPDAVGEATTYYVKEGEDFQFLAFKFFDDPKRWHELATINEHIYYPFDLKMADRLQVPV